MGVRFPLMELFFSFFTKTVKNLNGTKIAIMTSTRQRQPMRQPEGLSFVPHRPKFQQKKYDLQQQTNNFCNIPKTKSQTPQTNYNQNYVLTGKPNYSQKYLLMWCNEANVPNFFTKTFDFSTIQLISRSVASGAYLSIQQKKFHEKRVPVAKVMIFLP